MLAFSSIARESTVVVARAPSEIVFIDYAHIIKRCEKACDHHSLLVRNVLRLVADKTVRLSERIQVLSCRTIREKLLCYFNLSAARAGTCASFCPSPFSELADYICADRSAMMRELGHMRAGRPRVHTRPVGYAACPPFALKVQNLRPKSCDFCLPFWVAAYIIRLSRQIVTL